MARRFTASSEGKEGGEFKRGALLCVLIVFFRKGQCVFAFVLSQLCFTRMETSRSFLQGRMKQAFGGQWRFFWFVRLLWFFPSWIREMTFEQGLLTGILESQRDVGQGEIRKPAALPRKKYQWPWTVLIFPNQMWRGERKKNTEERHLPHSTFSSWGGFWEYETNQDNKLFSVFIDILPLCSTFLNLQF